MIKKCLLLGFMGIVGVICTVQGKVYLKTVINKTDSLITINSEAKRLGVVEKNSTKNFTIELPDASVYFTRKTTGATIELQSSFTQEFDRKIIHEQDRVVVYVKGFTLFKLSSNGHVIDEENFLAEVPLVSLGKETTDLFVEITLDGENLEKSKIDVSGARYPK